MPRDDYVIDTASFVAGACCLRERSEGGFVISWPSWAKVGVTVRLRLLDPHFCIIGTEHVIETSGKWSAVALLCLVDGGFALAWSDRDRLMLRWFDEAGRETLTQSLIKKTAQIPQLSLAQFSTGEVAVSWQDGVVIVRRGVGTISALSVADRWHSAAIMRSDDTFLHVDTGQHVPGWQEPPVYDITGRAFSASGRIVDTFEYRVPSPILSNSYVHPENICLRPRGDSLLMSWTMGRGHLGSWVEAVEFGQQSVPAGPAKKLIGGEPTCGVEEFETLPLPDGDVLGIWRSNGGMNFGLDIARFDHNLTLRDRDPISSEPVGAAPGLMRLTDGRVVGFAPFEEQIGIFVLSE